MGGQGVEGGGEEARVWVLGVLVVVLLLMVVVVVVVVVVVGVGVGWI